MSEDTELTPAQLDLLKELANIGIGNATTSLSRMLNDEKVTMDVPEVEVVPLQEVTEYLEQEKPIAAIFFEAWSEEFSLVLMFLVPEDSALTIANKVLKKESAALEEMERSALAEIGNIVTSSYLNALSSMTNITFELSTPSLAVDMGAAVISTVIVSTGLVEDYLILCQTSISTENEDINGNIFVFPFQGLDSMFELMGV